MHGCARSYDSVPIIGLLHKHIALLPLLRAGACWPSAIVTCKHPRVAYQVCCKQTDTVLCQSLDRACLPHDARLPPCHCMLHQSLAVSADGLPTSSCWTITLSVAI